MGPSNVNQSIGQEDYYLKNIYLSFKCLVNQLSKIDKKIKFFKLLLHKCTKSTTPLNEQSLLLPRNPYAIARYKVKNSIDTNELTPKI